MPTATVPNSAHKARRNPRACDACSRRSVRCRPAPDDSSACQNCVDFDEQCTFDRPKRPRGRRPDHATRNSNSALQNRLRLAERPTAQWTPPMAISQAAVMDLTEIFFEVVYPVFPLFHRASLIHRVSRGEHLEDRPLYASVAAMCALASARARDGALLRPTWDTNKLHLPPSERLFEAGVDAIPEDILSTQALDYMRACVLLSITAIQYGSPALMKYHLAKYHMYVAIGCLHDESQWPTPLSTVETEERRRLFWSAYTLDVFTSIVWGGVIHSREASSNVSYPTELDDEHLEARGAYKESLTGVTWLRGWNHVTDMYRILEHAASDLQQSRTATWRTPKIQALQESKSGSHPAIIDSIAAMHHDLPDIFKAVTPPTHDLRRDLYSFQAANIAATVQLVRMVYFSSDTSSLEQKCQVASDVLTAFAGMPAEYLRAISSPLLHHLAEIGRIFGAAFGSSMSASLYRSVRSVLLDLAAFLAELEKKLCCPIDASKKVESQIVRIDRFIREQCQTANESDGVPDQAVVSGSPENVDLEAFTLPGMNMEQQSPEFSFPPELFEDWEWAFTFT